MFRYRCPHCRQVLQALEIRAGKTTICSKCSRPLTIPADRSQWLNERGDPLAASPTLNLSSGAAGRSVPADEHDGDDVLGAIFVGADATQTGLTARDLPPARAAQPAAAAPPNLPPRPGRTPSPAPHAPRSAAWLLPPPRPEDARITPPPAPAPEPERPPARPAEPEETVRPTEPEETLVARRNEPPPEEESDQES